MNIVRITSGLGNQIFQYAFYRALKSNIPHTKMDISEFKHRSHHNGYELERIFNILPDYASKKECNSVADMSKDLWSDIRRKYLKINLKSSGRLISENVLGHFAHPDLLTMEDSYFQGFWQSEKYFIQIQDQLRKELTFKPPLDEANRLIAVDIEAKNSVSLHVRRGDYVKKRRVDTFGTVCSPDYYQKAIEWIQSRVDDPHYFIFSDDMAWVKANIIMDNAVYVDINSGKNSYKDMQLMSKCKHNIIANSSFSWWGAWLNSNPDKIVVAPGMWFRDAEMPDIVPESWYKIDI